MTFFQQKKIEIFKSILFLCGVFMQFLTQADATVPSKDPSSFETVDAYRRRLGFDYGYSAKSLNPELCKFLSEIECEEMDIQFGQEAKKTLQLAHQEESVNVLVILLRWADHEGRDLPPVEYYEQLWNGDGLDEVTHPTGSIANYTEVNTYGNMKVTATVTDWKTADNTEAFYSRGRRGVPDGSLPDITQAVASVLTQLDDEDFDFSRFDQNFDGFLDAVLVIHSGYAAEVVGSDCETGSQSSNRIQSIARPAIPGIWSTTSNFFRLEMGMFAIASGLDGLCGTDMARMGVITHEFFHLFGLEDFYDIGGTGTATSVGGIGAMGIMGFPYGPGSRSEYPGFLSPFSKVILGTIDTIEIVYNGVYEARASEIYPDIFKISAGFGDGEYLLIENRQPILFDQDLFSAGILIYHVDEQTEGIGNRLEGYPGMPGWPGNNNHFKVSVLAADRNYDLEKGVNNGDEGDFWRDGDVLGPGPGVSNAVDFSQYPNTDSYSGGDIRVTGITVSDFEETSPGVWSFRVEGLQDDPNENETTNEPTRSESGSPSNTPTAMPSTSVPSSVPSARPSVESVTSALSLSPSASPSAEPSGLPSLDSSSDSPTLQPSLKPTHQPSMRPSTGPSRYPSVMPSVHPSAPPSSKPSSSPSTQPSPEPSHAPSSSPSQEPSDYPSTHPSSSPSTAPSIATASPTSILQLRGNNLLLSTDDENDDSSAGNCIMVSLITVSTTLLSSTTLMFWIFY